MRTSSVAGTFYDASLLGPGDGPSTIQEICSAMSQPDVSVPAKKSPDIRLLFIFQKVINALKAAFQALKKSLQYKISLGFIKVQHILHPARYQWYNEIVPGIFLGAIPLHEKNHLSFMADKCVLTLLESHELKKTLVGNPVTASDYASQGIKHLQIPAQDFKPLTQEQLADGVAFLEQAKREERPVYVHCKAGRGRSAAIVLAYLVKHRYQNLNSAEGGYKFMKGVRAQINLRPDQMKAVKTYLDAQRQIYGTV